METEDVAETRPDKIETMAEDDEVSLGDGGIH